MNKLKNLLIVLIIAAAILSIPFLAQLFNGDEQPDRGIIQNIHFQNIATSIDTLSTESWNIDSYKNILVELNAAKSNDLIDDVDHELLEKNLNFEYIILLAGKTKEFYSKNCGDRELFWVLNSELRRYKNQDFEPNYRTLVSELRDATQASAQVIGWNTRTEPSKGLAGEIYNYALTFAFDPDMSKDYLKSLKEYMEIPQLRNCSLVKECMKRNRSWLDDHCYEELKISVNHYVRTSGYDKNKTTALRDRVKEYRNYQWSTDSQLIKKRSDGLSLELDQHRKEHKK